MKNFISKLGKHQFTKFPSCTVGWIRLQNFRLTVGHLIFCQFKTQSSWKIKQPTSWKINSQSATTTPYHILPSSNATNERNGQPIGCVVINASGRDIIMPCAFKWAMWWLCISTTRRAFGSEVTTTKAEYPLPSPLTRLCLCAYIHM